jgi:hypothetical protein
MRLIVGHTHLKVLSCIRGESDVADDQGVVESVSNDEVSRHKRLVGPEAGERRVQVQTPWHQGHVVGDDNIGLALDHNGAGNVLFFVRDARCKMQIWNLKNGF